MYLDRIYRLMYTLSRHWKGQLILVHVKPFTKLLQTLRGFENVLQIFLRLKRLLTPHHSHKTFVSRYLDIEIYSWVLQAIKMATTTTYTQCRIYQGALIQPTFSTKCMKLLLHKILVSITKTSFSDEDQPVFKSTLDCTPFTAIA